MASEAWKPGTGSLEAAQASPGPLTRRPQKPCRAPPSTGTITPVT